MINTIAKKTDAVIKRGAAQNIASVCYICGSLRDTDRELCPDCVKIISVGMKLLRAENAALYK